MLRPTRKAGYGLMALKYRAEHSKDTSLRPRDIAEAYHIPLQLLAKSLQRLAKVGILCSRIGMSGGYSLRKAPQQISAFDVICAIDGLPFIRSSRMKQTSSDLTQSCTIKQPLARVNNRIYDLLRNICISDLAKSQDGVPHALHGQDLVTIRMRPCDSKEVMRNQRALEPGNLTGQSGDAAGRACTVGDDGFQSTVHASEVVMVTSSPIYQLHRVVSDRV